MFKGCQSPSNICNASLAARMKVLDIVDVDAVIKLGTFENFSALLSSSASNTNSACKLERMC